MMGAHLRLVEPDFERIDEPDIELEEIIEKPKAMEQIPPPPALPGDINMMKPYGSYWDGDTYVMFYSQGDVSYNYAYRYSEGKYSILKPEPKPTRRIGFI